MQPKRISKSPPRKKSKLHRTGAALKRDAKRGSPGAFHIKETAMSILAGAAAGAVRALMPTLEEVTGSKGTRSKGRKASAQI